MGQSKYAIINKTNSSNFFLNDVVPSSSLNSLYQQLNSNSTFLPSCRTYQTISRKLENERSSSVYFCIFCGNVQTQFSLALFHYKVHLKFGFRCCSEKSYIAFTRAELEKRCQEKHNQNCKILDDSIQRPFVENWIRDFLNEKFLSSKFLNNEELVESKKVMIECPICKMAGKFKKKACIQYTSFRELERHFWIHSRWLRVDCITCGASTLRSKQRDHLLTHQLEDSCEC